MSGEGRRGGGSKVTHGWGALDLPLESVHASREVPPMKIRLICAGGECRDIDLPSNLMRVEIHVRPVEPVGPITHEWDDTKEQLIELPCDHSAQGHQTR